MRNCAPITYIFTLLAFLLNTFGPLPLAYADKIVLPKPGVMVPLSPKFNFPILKGIKVHPDNPFKFDFILDRGNGGIASAAKVLMSDTRSNSQSQKEQLKQESTKLIKYFLASLTIPENDLWVNLSPYEKNRIIPNSFGLTEMGRDLLAEDYMLKQVTASLLYPEDVVGKKFWKRVYELATKKYGTTNISVNTFNKVWIVPDKVLVYENAKTASAYIVESKLKVMLEEDYLSLKKHMSSRGSEAAVAISKGMADDVSTVGSQVVREVIIPQLNKEVNEGESFAQLRQIYNSLILAFWYKNKVKDSLLEKIYANKNKVAGIRYEGSVIARSVTTKALMPGARNSLQSLKKIVTSASVPRNDTDIEIIYQRYLQDFKKGVYNYIREDIDPVTKEIVPRKYFSGGALFSTNAMNSAVKVKEPSGEEIKPFNIPGLSTVSFNIIPLIQPRIKKAGITSNAAMTNWADKTLDQLSDAELNQLVGNFLSHYGHLMMQESETQTMQARVVQRLIWLANYVGPDFDKSRQEVYKKTIVQALWQINSNTAPNVVRFLNRLDTLYQVANFSYPEVMLESSVKLVWESVESFLFGEELIKKYEAQIRRMNTIPKSSLLPDADYELWARTIAKHNPSLFRVVLDAEADLINDPKRTATDYLFSLLRPLPEDQQREFALKILERLNNPANKELINVRDFWVFINSLPKKVGVLKNPRVLEHLYRQLVDVLKEDFDDFNNKALYEQLKDFYESQSQVLFTYMLYNPSPDNLKMAVKIWNQEREISDTELNKFNWLIGMVPKDSGNTRDRRRQIHRYMIRMIQFRHMADNEVGPSMAKILLAIDNKSFDRVSINELLDFILEFTNLSLPVQARIAKKADLVLAQWQRDLKGDRPKAPKEFLTPERFKQLREFMVQEKIDAMLDNLEEFTQNEKKDLGVHIRTHTAAWNRLGFLDTIASYIAFQKPEGKTQTEKLLKQLMRSKVVGDRFVSEERYENLAFSEEFIRQWSQPFSVELPIPANLEEARKLSYDNIRRDLLFHAGIVTQNNWDADRLLLEKRYSSIMFKDLNDHQNEEARAELKLLIEVVGEIVAQLNQGLEISSDQIHQWKKRLMPKGLNDPPYWCRRSSTMRELLFNLDQIGQVRPLDVSEIQRITFNVEDDPQVFMQSFLEPMQTCQRPSEPTQYNLEGQPINRARQGQFLVASIKIRYKDGHDEMVARSQLELSNATAEGKEAIIQSMFSIDDPSVLIAERIYSGLFSRAVFQDEITKWASGKGSFLNYVLFADEYYSNKFISKEIAMTLTRSDGQIYRDTFDGKGRVRVHQVDRRGDIDMIRFGLVRRNVFVQKPGVEIDLSALIKTTKLSVAEIEGILSKLGDLVTRRPDGKWFRNNAAMLNRGQLPISKNVKNGGIDFTPANMNLQTQNNGEEIKFHISAAMLAEFQNAPGFVPVIINIQPLIDLLQFMGIKSGLNRSTPYY